MLARLHDEYSPRKVQILAINVVPQFSGQEFLAYMKRLGGGAHLYAVDASLQIARAYGIRTLGESVFVDRRGELIERVFPPGLSYDAAKQLLDRLLT